MSDLAMDTLARHDSLVVRGTLSDLTLVGLGDVADLVRRQMAEHRDEFIDADRLRPFAELYLHQLSDHCCTRPGERVTPEERCARVEQTLVDWVTLCGRSASRC